MKKLLLALSFSSLFFACQYEGDPSPKYAGDATVAYYFSAKPSASYDVVSFSFHYTRAYMDNAIRTVYLDQKDVLISLNTPEPVILGASNIESETVNGYNLSLSGFKVIDGTDTLLLSVPPSYNDYYAAGFSLDKGELKSLTFELDVEASLLLDSAGKNWIKPKFKLK